jgi:nucleoid DNA-binding protein
MGRVDIVNAMVKETGFKKDDCEKIIKSFITNIAHALKEGDKITLKALFGRPSCDDF